MKFSIVIPVYNTQEDHFEACIDSIAHQSEKDYEIIIVDDGSSRQTKQALNQVTKRYVGFSITIVTQNNRGLLQARRAGFAKAQGDYCLSLDSDDMLRPDTLEKITKAIENSGADLVLFNASRSLDYSKSLYDYSMYSNLSSASLKNAIVGALCGSADGCFNNMALKAFKRDLLENCCNYESYGRLQYGEDLLQSMELIDLSKKIVLLNENLYFYRPTESSITRSFYQNRLEDIKVVHTKLRDKARDWSNTFDCANLEVKISFLDLVNAYAFLLSAESVAKEEAIEAFRSVRMDPYFITAWDSTAVHNLLSIEKRITLNLLFQKKYNLLLLYVKCVHIAKQLRACLT